MRFSLLILGVSAAVLLGACDAWETAPPPAPSTAAVAETAPPTFEDNSCLGFLLLQRAAIAGGRAQGDVAAVSAAIAAWRARGGETLTADEMPQYETSSKAVSDDDNAQTIGERAQACVTSAPQAPAAPATPPETPPG
jgi:hypothetical protein